MRTINQIQEQERCSYVAAIDIQQAERKSELPSSTGSGPALTRKLVVLEGRLELEKIAVRPPAECRHNCDMHLRRWLCGVARTKSGATNIAVLEQYLESLAGKYVRITIEAEEQNERDKPTGGANG